MATLVSQAPILGQSNVVATIAKNIATTIQQRRQYRVTLTELSALSTRDLDDLGIARRDIRRLAREAAYGS